MEKEVTDHLLHACRQGFYAHEKGGVGGCLKWKGLCLEFLYLL